MRGVNLDVFDFDYDLTGAGFFLNADEKVYGRYGGRGARVRGVAPGSAAARAGLRPDDVLLSVGGLPVASIADAQYALHRAPARGKVPVAWRRQGRECSASLELAGGWRKTDLSWRWS